MSELIVEHGVTYEVFYIEHSNCRSWHFKTMSHREEGPALECAAEEHSDCPDSKILQLWYKHGSFHREDGPAFVNHSGYAGYYLDGVIYSCRETFLYELELRGKLIYVNDNPYLIDGRPIKDI